MIFRELMDYLSEISDITILSDNVEEEIADVKFIDPRQSQFRSEVLYFGNSLHGITSLPPQCIITDKCDISDADLSVCSAAVVSDEDFGYIFNSGFQRVRDSHKDGYYESLIHTLERVRNVDALIDLASKTFGASLVFIDRNFRILSYSTQIPVTDELWKHNIEQGYCDYEFITAVRSLKSVQTADWSMMPVEVSCPSSPFKKFSCRVYCRDIWIGYIIVIENSDSYRPEHAEMLKVLSGVLGYAVMQYEPNYLYMTSDYHHFLYNLLIGADASSFPEAYGSLTFPSQMQVLYCRATGNRSAFPNEADISHMVASIVPGCHVINRRSSSAIIGSRELVAKAGQIAAAFPDDCRIKIGISMPFSDITELKAHYDEAHDAFELGDILDPDLSIYTFEEYGIYVMFRTVAKAEQLSRYLHPALTVLEEYDRVNGSHLEQTLYTYIKCACNTTETAASLFLHRNSVIYRLRRIEELCNIDLDDTDTRFRLRLSFAISDVISRTT
jgi:hypothetical protein